MIRAESNVMLESQKPIYDIASDTEQYFWYTSTGTDTGAHITEKTQDEFVADPQHGGANVLARNNGIAVRDGLTELARFKSNGIDLGMNTDEAVINLNNNKGKIHGRYEYGTYVLGFGIPNSATFGTGTNNVRTKMHSDRAVGTNGYANAETVVTTYSAGATSATSSSYAPNGDESFPISYAHVGQNAGQGYSDATLSASYAEEDDADVIAEVVAEAYASGSSLNLQADTINMNTPEVYVNGSLVHSSDRRLKEHIKYLDGEAVEFVRKLKPAYYFKDAREHSGFYAQDVEANGIGANMVREDKQGYKALSYAELIAPLVAYCQHLEKRIEELEKKK